MLHVKNEDGRAMLMSFHLFCEKQNLCRFYTDLVCFYPSQWCSLVWGYGLLWWGVHALWDRGNGALFLGSPCLLVFLPFTFLVKDTFNF